MPKDAPLRDADLAVMIKDAMKSGDADEVRQIRAVAALPPEKRRAALTGGTPPGKVQLTERGTVASPVAPASMLAAAADARAKASKMSDAESTRAMHMTRASGSMVAGDNISKASRGDHVAKHEEAAAKYREAEKEYRAAGNTQLADKAKAKAKDADHWAEENRKAGNYGTGKKPDSGGGGKYGPPPAGVKPAAWEAANNHSLDGLDPDDPKFREVGMREGIDRDDLVEAAEAIGQADPARKPSSAKPSSKPAEKPAAAPAADGGLSKFGLRPLKDGADSTERAQHSGRVRDKAKEIAPVGSFVKIGNTEYRVSGHTATSVSKSYNNPDGTKVDVGLHRLNDRGMVAGRTTTRITLDRLEAALVRKPESKEPEADRERDQRAEKRTTRARADDAAADARVKEREKLAAYNRRRRARGQAPVLRLPDSMKSLDLALTPDDVLDAYADSAPDLEEFKGDVVGWDDYPDVLEVKRSRASLDRSPKKNWVENTGELPGYIREVARAIHEDQGLPLSRAIPIAIGRIKRWAAGGGGVNADTVAKAQAAVAAWEKLKAKARAKYDSTLLEVMESKGLLDDEDGDYDWPDVDDEPEPEVKALDDEEVVPDDLDSLFAEGAELKAKVGVLDLFEQGAELRRDAAPFLESKIAPPNGGEQQQAQRSGGGGGGRYARVVRTEAGARRYGVRVGEKYTPGATRREEPTRPRKRRPIDDDDRPDLDPEGKTPQRGQEGPVTKSAQEVLVRLGLLEPREDGSVHGKFGPRTEEAVREFQEDNGLPVTGKLDASTLSSIKDKDPGESSSGKPAGGGSSSSASAKPAAARPAAADAPGGDPQGRVAAWYESLRPEVRKRVEDRARAILAAARASG
jgi:hypothetical protein